MSDIQRLVFVRHVASTWSELGILQGLQDPPLGESGKRQLPCLAKIVHRACEGSPTEIFSSNRRRALETAQFLSRALGDVPVYAREELREVSFGIWEGRPESSLAEDPVAKRGYDLVDVEFCWPGAQETLEERAHQSTAFILSQLQGNPNTVTVFVSHGLILQATLAQLLFNDMHYSRAFILESGSVSVLEYHQANETFAARWIGVPCSLFLDIKDREDTSSRLAT